MINSVEGQPQIIDTIQCPKTKECKNDQCFWRQRDVHKLSPFYFNDKNGINSMDYNKKITEEFGKPYFPEMFVEVGTNCIYLFCPDFRK